MTLKSMRILGTAIGLFAVVIAVAVPASAFTFEERSGFLFGTETSTAGLGKGISFFGSVGTPAGTWGTMGWGNQSGASFTTATDPFTLSGDPIEDRRSALRLTTFSGTINPGDTVVISKLTHANRKILLPFLTSADIPSRLQIFDGGPAILTNTTSIPLSFTETLNTATEGECDAATHIGGTDPCSDFFLFPFGAFAPVTFSNLGVDYTLTFDLIPVVGTLFDVVIAECDSSNGTGGGDTCGRVRTAENINAEIDITMTLNQVGIPAPASLVLLGLALASAGVVGRLRSRKNAK